MNFLPGVMQLITILSVLLLHLFADPHLTTFFTISINTVSRSSSSAVPVSQMNNVLFTGIA